MLTMLILTCPLCGLRYSNRPLLELHIREDHRPRRRAQPGTRDAGSNPSSRAPGPIAPAGSTVLSEAAAPGRASPRAPPAVAYSPPQVSAAWVCDRRSSPRAQGHPVQSLLPSRTSESSLLGSTTHHMRR